MKKTIALIAALICAAIAYAADIKPSTWITNYTYSAGSVAITNTTFTANGATTNDLAESTGDVREVTKALLTELYDTQESLTGTTNAISYMSIAKRVGLNNSGQLTTTFTVTFISDINSATITDE